MAKSAREWPDLIDTARSAIQALCERRSEFIAMGMSEDALAAARIAGVAIDFLAGDEEGRPHALVQVQRMRAALERTALDTLEEEIAMAANHQQTAKTKAAREALLQRFLHRIGPHLESLGVARHRLPKEATAAVLARWRAHPIRQRGELGTSGVMIALLVLTGEDEQNARMRVRRRTLSR